MFVGINIFSTNKIKHDLVGTYSSEGELAVRSFSFDGDGSFYESYYSPILSPYEKIGTYEINKDAITLTYRDGEQKILRYTCSKDTGNPTLHLEHLTFYKVR